MNVKIIQWRKMIDNSYQILESVVMDEIKAIEIIKRFKRTSLGVFYKYNVIDVIDPINKKLYNRVVKLYEKVSSNV